MHAFVSLEFMQKNKTKLKQKKWLHDSQDGAGLEVFLIHPFWLTYLQDLCVAQVLQAALELVQGIRLGSECSHDLLPHHLHYLHSRAEKQKRARWDYRGCRRHNGWRQRACTTSKKTQEVKITPLTLTHPNFRLRGAFHSKRIYAFYFFQNLSF